MTKCFLLIALVSLIGRGISFAAPAPISLFEKDISFRNEVQRAIDRGLMWLQKSQNTNGYWSTADQPAVTALAVAACKGDPNGRYNTPEPDWLKKGYAFILRCARPD